MVLWLGIGILFCALFVAMVAIAVSAALSDASEQHKWNTFKRDYTRRWRG